MSEAIEEAAAAQVVRTGALNVQVCVPADWTDEQVTEFANREHPCGTENGWFIRTDPALLANDPARNPCSERKNFVHVMFDA